MLARLLHLSLATLLLVSSAGANVSTHLCGGVAVGWSVYALAGDCGMGERPVATVAADSDGPSVQRAPCCEDELSYHQLDVDQADADTDAPVTSPGAAFAKTARPYPTPERVAAAVTTRVARIRPPPDPLPQRRRRAALRIRRI